MTTSSLARIREVPAADLVGFLAFSHGWTWAWWGVNVVWGLPAFGAGLPFTLLGGTGPLLGGVVMSHVTYGREGLADLWERLVDPRRVRPRWWVVVVGFFPAVALLVPPVATAATGTAVPFDAGELWALLGAPATLAATVLVILVVGPLPEEIGWRGYLLDRCQRRWSALVSGLAVGVAWAAWHAPLFVMPGYFENFDFAPDPAAFATNIVLVSVVYTWVYNNTRRSVFAVVAFHFLENFVGQVTTLPPAAEPVRLALLAAIVVAVVALFSPGSLRRDGTVPSPPDEVDP